MSTDHGHDTPSTGESELWSLREDVHVELENGNGPVRLESRWGDITIQRPSRLLREVLRRMRLGPIMLENVIGQEPGGSGRTGSAAADREELHRVLDRLQPLIIRSLSLETGQPLLSVVPLTPQSRFQPAPLPADVPVRLSTYAELRTDGREYRLESPLALHRVVLHKDQAIALIGRLARPVTPAAWAVAQPLRFPDAADVLAYLAAAGMVVQAADSVHGLPVFAEDTDPALAGWTPADLMFHTRRTLGRHDNDFGRTYPLGSAGSPEPVVKPRRTGPGIPLHRPDWDDLHISDPPLIVAMEGRRSKRSYGTSPITAEELGDLLYRTARLRSLITPPSLQTPVDEDDPDPRLSDRPYPGAGSCYELELYITVGQCSGLASGQYHYDPMRHQLEPVEADDAMVDELLLCARLAAAMDSPPPVLITMTARFRRLSWKYAALSYAVALMDVGVLIQSLYLVCTAMRLAPCAVSAVRIDATARAFGTDWRAEPSVGQFIVGRDPGTDGVSSWRWESVNDADWSELARADLREPDWSSRRSESPHRSARVRRRPPAAHQSGRPAPCRHR